MRFQLNTFLLQDFGGDSANETAVLLVLLNAILFVSKLSEGVDHNT